MIDTKALREKVLDLAIRGKLVPQDPNDEPASVLLERIRAEKEQMVKDGKLKAKDIKNDTIIIKGDDNLHYEQFPDGTVKCIEDEIPFDIPNGWSWCRFSSAFIINPRNQLSDDMSVSFVPMPLIQEGYANKHIDEEKIWGSVKSGFTHFANNDVGVAKITPCFENKKSVVFKGLKNGYGAGTTELHIIRTIGNLIYPEYVLWNVKTDNFISNGIKAFSGAVGQKRIGKDFIEKSLIPIAPTNEQKRILECISIAFGYIDSIEASKEAFKVDIQSIKSKILDLAIRGKLVPQNPDDEPASILLERIRAEKEQLIKQGKIKRDKKESVILKGEDNSYYEKICDNIVCIDDEIPYIIPENWMWCRLTAIADIVMGSSPNGTSINTNGQGIEFHQGKIFFKNKVIGKSDKTTTEPTKIAKENSVLLCVRAPVGEVNITNREICIGRGLTSIHPIGEINVNFLFYWLKTYKEHLNLQATGSTFVAITADAVKEILLPLPPLTEQEKIVTAIQNADIFLNEIKRSF